MMACVKKRVALYASVYLWASLREIEFSEYYPCMNMMHGYKNGFVMIRRLLRRHIYRPEMETHGIGVGGGLEPKPLTWMKTWLEKVSYQRGTI